MRQTRNKIILALITLFITISIGFNYVLPKVLLKLSRELPTRYASSYGLRFDRMEVLSFDSLILKGDFIYPFERNYLEKTSSHSVIFLHPIKENSQSIHPFLRNLTNLDVNFITFDLRSHGRSDGHLYTLGVNEAKDISSIIDYILSIHPDHSFGIYGRKNTGNILLKALEMDKRISYGILENYDNHPIETIEKMNYDDVFIKNRFLKNRLLDQTLKAVSYTHLTLPTILLV